MMMMLLLLFVFFAAVIVPAVDCGCDVLCGSAMSLAVSVCSINQKSAVFGSTGAKTSGLLPNRECRRRCKRFCF